jgi:hypothetical protein
VSQRYEGYNGQIVIDGQTLRISREGVPAQLASLAGAGLTIALSEISDVVLRKPTLFVNGYLRIALGGASAELVPAALALRDHNTVLFRWRDRHDFAALYEWLVEVVQVNRSRGQEITANAAGSTTSRDRVFAGPVTQVPRTADQLRELVNQRPLDWEYRLFAGVLLQSMNALESKWRDHELRYAPGDGRYFDAETAVGYLTHAWQRAGTFGAGLERILDRQAQTRAFGLPGQSGDSARIEHLAQRLVGIYEACLDWAADLRSISVPSELSKSFDLAAQVMDRPAEDIRQFIDQYVAEVEGFPEMLAKSPDEPIMIQMTLSFTLDDRILAEYQKELRRARRRLGLR